MRVPVALTTAFGKDFERLLSEFAVGQGLIPSAEELSSNRFFSRSVVPHVLKLSALFNRNDERNERGQEASLDPYWKDSSNAKNLRLAYFLYFMPCNLYRVAAVWSELARLGYRWDEAGGPSRLKGVEFGAGPASGACGIAAGELHAPLGLPTSGDWALIEQEKSMLQLGAEWAKRYFESSRPPEQSPEQSVESGALLDWGVRTFHRRVDPQRGFLPETAPRFNLWLMSYYLNELDLPAPALAKSLIHSWDRHVEMGGLIVLVEPALKAQSRRLLELRKEILAERDRRGIDWLQILLPCLGHQACGALAEPEDWCHENVSWWRPPYLRLIDDLASLDHKSLPFSYLVLAKSGKSREVLLPRLAEGATRHRLVSPSHPEGREQEFFVCGQDGKRRARVKAGVEPLERGDILLDAQIRGDRHASRIDSLRGRL